MTSEEMVKIVTDNNVRGNLVGMLKKNFPRDTANAEDWAQRALIRLFKYANKVYDAAGIDGYAREAAMSVAMHDKERQAERRKTLKGLPRATARRDPMRHIDYKVDLERAVRKTTTVRALQAALWEIYYDKATWKEVLDDMPKHKTASAWEWHLKQVNRELRQELRRKGYRRK